MKILKPLSLVYLAAVKADKFLNREKALDKPIISIGNLTWGGSGKTPMVIEAAQFLISQNKKPAVLTRGYGRKSKAPVLLQNAGAQINPLEAGDEPLLISKSAPGASVIVGSKRYKNALKFKNKTAPDIYILDDGFQHWKIERDLDIVCINAAKPFGNNMLIPAGNLREPVSALERADLAVITNADMVSAEEIHELQKKLPVKDTAVTQYEISGLKTTDLQNDFDIEQLKNKKVFALSALGFSEGFGNSLAKAGIKTAGNISLRDHNTYGKNAFSHILKTAGTDAYFVTTAKDAVKIDFFADADFKAKTAVLTVKPKFISGRDLWEQAILRALGRQFF